jgi:hypothetical protein
LGTWYELVVACDLRNDVPQQVVDILNYLISPPFNEKTREPEPFLTPEHQFFTRYQWHTLLLIDCYYFPGDPFGSLTLDEYAKFYKFTARAKHRYHDLIASFLHWLAPYCRTQGFVGYTRCDETPENIDLIYIEHDHAYYRSIGYATKPPNLRVAKISEDGTTSIEAD